MAANMYRVRDYVYFENSSSNSYLIRRIEELNTTASGNVEAKVVCFHRRQDISNTLILLADKHAKEIEEESETIVEIDLTDKQKHQLKHRDLFSSLQYESLPVTHIRGKRSVAVLNETESVLSYLDKEDTFFYSLVYDPSVKTLLADKGEIRVGPRHQADIPEMADEDCNPSPHKTVLSKTTEKKQTVYKITSQHMTPQSTVSHLLALEPG
ncbi:Metastasis-associated protein MTA3 [Heterocephalus glaber]|uniref:Metastasis-associated protein MTA3 n=1 Tax=Heterocephalus glaber TaxID=10181 RepID=G5B7X2_HETGA|nr:Metastasis-associated protein MTA3 [Heterocephalus glaber]